MKDKKDLAAPVLWTVFTVLWIIIFILRLSSSQDEGLLVMSGLCVILGAVNALIQWTRYKKNAEDL